MTMTKRRKKRIAIVDAGRRTEIVDAILPYIEERYEFELTTDYGADYVFHSCMGYDVLKYSGIRIFVTGENVSPNFNISDYAMAFDKMDFGDRYCWLPSIVLRRNTYANLAAPRRAATEVITEKSGFCAYVMSNTKNSATERTRIFDLLSNYKPVHSGGKWRNNVGGPVADKIAFQSKYKFVIAFENSSSPGYLTEKFSEAALSNAIPIYWGDPDIGKIFNEKAFINCHNFDSLESVLEQVKLIDSNEELYLQMLSEDWFPQQEAPEDLGSDKFIQFLSHIFDQPHATAFRRNRSRWGLKSEQSLAEMSFRPDIQALKLLRKKLRKILK